MMVMAVAGMMPASLSGATMASPAPSPLPIACSAEGAKLVAALSPAAVCQRFVAAFAVASGRQAVASTAAPADLGDGLVVELRFLPQGVAMASTTAVRGGKPAPMRRFELAVSDRGFVAADIDRLAADTARGIGTW
jgi:hypothetical protein